MNENIQTNRNVNAMAQQPAQQRPQLLIDQLQGPLNLTVCYTSADMDET